MKLYYNIQGRVVDGAYKSEQLFNPYQAALFW